MRIAACSRFVYTSCSLATFSASLIKVVSPFRDFRFETRGFSSIRINQSHAFDRSCCHRFTRLCTFAVLLSDAMNCNSNFRRHAYAPMPVRIRCPPISVCRICKPLAYALARLIDFSGRNSTKIVFKSFKRLQTKRE